MSSLSTIKTVLITGASTGIGKSTARYFYDKGRNVVATMRSPEKEHDLTQDDRLKILRLDVQDKESIQEAVRKSLEIFGTIDVLVNNAGYGVVGPLEAAADEQIHKQFDVNFFGLIDCIKAVLPHMRSRRLGTIINISSIGGLMTVPSWSLYNASKFALEGLSEALYYELGALGIRVKLVEPGLIKTDFSGRSMDNLDYSTYPDYNDFMERVRTTLGSSKRQNAVSDPLLVAQVIYKATTDQKTTLRYRAGADAQQLWFLRRLLGPTLQIKIMKKFMGLK